MIGDFFAHLSSVFPSQINVDVTEFCNLACAHCPYETVTKPKGAKRRHFPVELNRIMVDQVAADGKGSCRFIRYTGEGEPLLHPHLLEVVGYAAKVSGVPVNLTTNGQLLTEDRARALLAAGVAVFDVSIDAHSEQSYGKVRAGGHYLTVRDNTLRLIDLARRQGGAKVMVSFVAQPDNQSEAEDFKAFWQQEGADFVVVRPCHSAGGSVPAIAQAMRDANSSERRPCLYPWERVLIKPDGQVSFCPVDWNDRGNIGSLYETSIAQLWQGEQMQALRRAHCANDFSAHAFCGQCPDWSLTLWPQGGTTYDTVMRRLTRGDDD